MKILLNPLKCLWINSILMLIILIATSQTTNAANDEPVAVKSILVTANRVLQDLFNLPMTVNVVTAEDIAREPYTNITELLNSIPGVEIVASSQAGAQRISIRGEDVSRTLIIINGVKNVDKRMGQNAFQIDPSQIERIEIIKGPSSVLYGPEAIGGVINIITKKGGNKPIGFSQNFVYDTSTESADIQTAIFGRYNGFNYRVSASGVNAGNRKIPSKAPVTSENGTATTSSYKNRYYSGQVGYDWGNNSVSLQADHYDTDIEYSNGKSMLQSNVRMRMPGNKRDTIIGNIIFRDVSEYLAKLDINASYQTVKRNMLSDFENPMYGGYVGQVISIQDQIGTTIQAEWSLGSHYLTSGFEATKDDIAVDNNTDFYGAIPSSYSHADVEQLSLGLFIQDEWTFYDNWRATIGLRESWIESEFKGKSGSSFTIPNPAKKKHTSLVGSFGLTYTGIDNLALRAQWSQGNRYPSVQQLFTGSAGHGGGEVSSLPNPDLVAETSNNYEIGARYIGNGWNSDLAVFYSEAKNYIDTYVVQRIGPNTIDKPFNASKATTLGAELSLGYTFDDISLTPYTNLTWLQRTQVLKDNFKTKNTQTPDWRGRVGVKWEHDLDSINKFYSDVYMDWANEAVDDRTISSTNPMASHRKTIYPAWQTLNLTVGVQGGDEHKYNVSLSLRNIGDQYYTKSKGSSNLPEAGFHAVLGVGFEF